MPTPQELLESLKSVKYPGFSRDIVSFGMVKDIAIGVSRVVVQIAPSTGNADVIAQVRSEVLAILERLVELPIEVEILQPGGQSRQERPAQPQPQPQPQPHGHAHPPKPQIPGIQNVIAVASGKGGVGKSTVSVNLAAALASMGKRVGVLDADVYGPSVPLMLGLKERPKSTEDKKIIPLSKYNLKVMSMGFLLTDDQAVVWRGPMIDKLLTEFIRNVEWGELDVLVVDLPPGTGDAQLTMVQKAPLSGGVIVTTPQDVALADVRRGMQMFEEVHVPVLGVVENMSYLVCSSCGHKAHVFSHGGGAEVAKQFNVPLLGEIPLVRDIVQGGDEGTPIMVSQPEHPQSRVFVDIAGQVLKQL